MARLHDDVELSISCSGCGDGWTEYILDHLEDVMPGFYRFDELELEVVKGTSWTRPVLQSIVFSISGSSITVPPDVAAELYRMGLVETNEVLAGVTLLQLCDLIRDGRLGTPKQPAETLSLGEGSMKPLVFFPDALARINLFMACPTDRFLPPDSDFWKHAPARFLESHIWNLAASLWNGGRNNLRVYLGRRDPHAEGHGFAPTTVFVELSSPRVLEGRQAVARSPFGAPGTHSKAHLVFVTWKETEEIGALIQNLVDQVELRWEDVAVNCNG